MNIPLISGQIALLHVKLETEDDFELYGGTTKAGFSITPERPESKNEWLVTIDELEVAGKPLTRFDIYVRQISSGREWVVLSGKLLVSPRSAGVDADKLNPIEYNVTIPVVENAVDLTGAAIVTGIPGPRGWSAYEIAVQNGFEGTEPEWLEYMRQQTATLAVEQVTPLMERAETAAGEAEQSAANASQSLNGAKAFARGAKEEADRADAAADKAAQHEETVRGLINYAAAHESNAKAYAEQAKDSSDNADAALYAAKQAMQEANASAANASEKAANATQKATEAAGSAAQAAADKLAAEQAKQDAQAAQTKAEQEAVKAEKNAALLGDAALKGADNTFSGLNTFAGEVAGVLPWDFFAYSWCKTKEELWAVCPDIEQRKVFCADLTNMEDVLQPNNGDGILLPNNIKTACVYFAGDMKGKYTLGRGINYLYVYAPNATSYGRIRYMSHVVNAVIYVPNAKTDASVLFDRMAVINLTLVCKNTKMDNWTINGYGYAATSMKTLRCPLNILQTVNLADYKVLQDVPCGFPHATLINFQAAKLNKASVMAILNALKPYDAATMSTVPELTLGIDKTLDGDEEINAALLNAQTAVEDGGKGWNVAVAGFTVTAGGGATMGLRKPIYAQRRAAADGAYIDAAGTRWSVRYGNTVLENWVVNEELGYTEFPNLAAALEEWGLTEYVPELPEESLTETE